MDKQDTLQRVVRAGEEIALEVEEITVQALGKQTLSVTEENRHTQEEEKWGMQGVVGYIQTVTTQQSNAWHLKKQVDVDYTHEIITVHRSAG